MIACRLCCISKAVAIRLKLPCLHWHSADGRLQTVAGAWRGDNINPFHRHKATSFPDSKHDAIEALLRGFTAVVSGEAFLEELPVVIDIPPVTKQFRGFDYVASYDRVKNFISVSGYGLDKPCEYLGRGADTNLGEALDHTFEKIIMPVVWGLG